MDFAARGDAALSSGDAFAALSAYTKALLEHPASPDYFIQRATALTRLKAPHQRQYGLSLIDAEFAVLLAQKRAVREKIQAAQHRRVVAFFGLEQFANAAYILQTMKPWTGKEKAQIMEASMWTAKVQQHLNKIPEGDPTRLVTVKEFPERELPPGPEMVKLLQGQLKSDGTFRFPGEVDDTSAPSDGENTEAASAIPAATPEVSVTKNPVQSSASPIKLSSPAKIRHEWYQGPTHVTIIFYAKGVSKDKAEIEIEEDSLSVSFPQPTDPSSTYTFTLDPLFSLIDKDASTASIMSTKVEITLRKKTPGQKWNDLKGSGPLRDKSNQKSDPFARAAVMSAIKDDQVSPNPTAPAYPTSSRTGPKNWDKVAADLTAKKDKGKAKGEAGAESKDDAEGGDEDADSDYGGDAVDGFFKKLYAGADRDTQRAMMKSYQESGGTALSTDWTDVGKRTVVPVESKKDD